jgi:hypothetical protein
VIVPRHFLNDDGSLTYARAEGIYVDGAEAPTHADRVVEPRTARRGDSVVILTFGQSNAANAGEGCYAAKGPVHVLNIFDRKYYRAADPLPGASSAEGAIWSRLGDRLVESGRFGSVLFVPIAYCGSYIAEWAPGGTCHRRLQFAIKRISSVGLVPDILCWHQGEAEANLTSMSTAQYRQHFLTMLQSIREAGIDAPIFVATSTLCANAEHPFHNRDAIRAAQQGLAAAADAILPGPDTDSIGVEHRRDGCHFSTSGLDLAAQAWFEALVAHPVEARQLSREPARASQISSRLRLLVSTAGMTSLIKQSTYLVKQAILREFDRRGYLLVKKPEHRPLLRKQSGSAPGPMPYSGLGFVDPSVASEFEAVCGKLDGMLGIPPRQAYAAFCAARDLVREGVVGDVVDCGEGSAETLAVIAATLAALGDTSREVVLFDISGVPGNRAETDLTLWGSNRDHFAERRSAPRHGPPRPLPEELLASGYPIDKLRVARYPADAIDLTRSLCFLALTTETYEANRAAISALMPRVAPGGAIAVSGNNGPRISFPGCVQHRVDAVADYLARRGAELSFRQIAPTYRIAIMPQQGGKFA